MRFLFLLHEDPTAVDALDLAERREIVERHLAYRRRLVDDGVLVLADAIGDDAPVRLDFGALRQVVDGPVAETKEQLGAFYVVDCADREQALAYARDLPRSPGLTATVLTIAPTSPTG
jgi:hypothetical protein